LPSVLSSRFAASEITDVKCRLTQSGRQPGSLLAVSSAALWPVL
jgi:hypothetical protein